MPAFNEEKNIGNTIKTIPKIRMAEGY